MKQREVDNQDPNRITKAIEMLKEQSEILEILSNLSKRYYIELHREWPVELWHINIYTIELENGNAGKVLLVNIEDNSLRTALRTASERIVELEDIMNLEDYPCRKTGTCPYPTECEDTGECLWESEEYHD